MGNRRDEIPNNQKGAERVTKTQRSERLRLLRKERPNAICNETIDTSTQSIGGR